jgi:hypothetical protein
VATAEYSKLYWFFTGAVAANVPAYIFPLESNALAPLFADQAATIGLPNPVNTSAGGVLTFWAEAGDYWVYIDKEVFQISVGMSQEEADLSSGTASGGEITPSLTNPQAIDIAPLVGYVVAQTADGFAPTVQRVTSDQRTEVLSGPSLGRILTWWLLDSSDNVIQQGFKPTPPQRRTMIPLGLTAYDGGSVSIVFDQTLPVILNQPVNQLADLMDGLGPFVVSGNRLSANPGTLTFNKTEGVIFARAFNHIPDPDNPHWNTLIAQAPQNFQYNTQNPFSEGPLTTLVDPANYDVGGVVTPIPNPTDWTIQRVWGYPLNDPNQQIRIQYGQALFPTEQDAINGIGNIAFIANPEADPFGALVAHLVIRADATDLSDGTQAMFRRSSKFATP